MKTLLGHKPVVVAAAVVEAATVVEAAAVEVAAAVEDVDDNIDGDDNVDNDDDAAGTGLVAEATEAETTDGPAEAAVADDKDAQIAELEAKVAELETENAELKAAQPDLFASQVCSIRRAARHAASAYRKRTAVCTIYSGIIS